MDDGGPAQKPRGSRTRPPMLQHLLDRFKNLWMPGQAEIVIGRKIDELFTFDRDVRAFDQFDRPQAAPERLGFERLKVFLDAVHNGETTRAAMGPPKPKESESACSKDAACPMRGV